MHVAQQVAPLSPTGFTRVVPAGDELISAARARLPGSALATTGPWKPRATRPTDPLERAKGDTVKAALRAALLAL